MPAYLGPPPHPWVPRPESAFGPIRAWFPYDSGARFREFVRGADAAITFTYSWGSGAFGPAAYFAGGSALASGISLPGAFSVTIAHLRDASVPGSPLGRGLCGWGGGFQGIYQEAAQLSILDNGSTRRLTISLNPATTAWRVLTVALAGSTSGSQVDVWADGRLVGSGTLSANLTAATNFVIGGLGAQNPTYSWLGGIGPTYLHDRVLAGREIRLLHADPWRLFRDQGSQLPRTFYSIPPPWSFSGAGTGGTPSGAGAIGFTWPASGAGTAGTPSGEGVLEAAWEFAGAGTAGDPVGSGELATAWEFAGAGLAGDPEGAGELDWEAPPWEFSGAGVMAAPSGSGVFADLRPTGPCGGSLFLWMDLIQRIAVRRPTVGQDAVGGTTKDWVVIRFDLPASIHPLSGAERRAIQMADGTTVSHRVYLDPCDVVPLKSTDQFEYQGRIFEIVTPMVTAETGELYAVDCRELIL